MNERIDEYLSRPQTGSPLRIPEGYFDSLEDRVMGRIAAQQEPRAERKSRVWTILKPALTLAAMFALVFGMGYGVLSLTHTLDRGTGTAASDYATVEEELIRPSSLYNYYQSDGQAEEDELDEESLVDYLATQLSFADLAEIYAQSYQK